MSLSPLYLSPLIPSEVQDTLRRLRTIPERLRVLEEWDRSERLGSAQEWWALVDATRKQGTRKEEQEESMARARTEKEEGNTAFRRGDLSQAITHYTEALFVGTETDASFMAVCFQNRAATLQRMNRLVEALKDAQIAASLDPSYTKAHCRVVQCQEALRDKGEDDGQVPSTRGLLHPGLVVRVDPQPRGRYLVATEGIARGAVILEEEPYVLVLLPEWRRTRCHWCLRTLCHGSPSWPCLHCSHARYCSAACADRAWKVEHRDECGRALYRLAPPELVVALRVVRRRGDNGDVSGGPGLPVQARAGFDVPAGVNPETRTLFTDDRCVSSLQAHEDSISAAVRADHAILAHLAVRCLDGALDAQAIARVLLQLRSNLHSITELIESTTTQDNGVMEEEQSRIAEAIYLNASMINHSCRPNTLLFYKGRRMIMRAAPSEISPGEEVTNCYGPHAGHHRRRERQAALWEQYHFVCSCQACETEADFDGLICLVETCPGSMHQEEEAEEDREPRRRCNRCGCVEDCTIARKRTHQLATADTLFTRAKELCCEAWDTEARDLLVQAASMFRKCLKIQKRIVHARNRTLARTHDSLAQCLASLGEYNEATEECYASLWITEKMFGEGGVEVGHEYLKLATLCFNAQRMDEAAKAIAQAEAILTVSFGSDSPQMRELQSVKTCLRHTP